MHRTAKVSFAVLAAAVLGCACDRAWRLNVTVIIPPNVQASYADSLPAGVFISGQKLDDENESAIGSRFAPRTLGLICEPSTIPKSFHTTVDEAGCGVETRVHAWLQSQTGLRDFLEASTDNVTTSRTISINGDRTARPLSVICDELAPIDTDTIHPSATPSSTAPLAEGIAFSGQHPGDCDRQLDSVSLVLDTPGE
jgi:hypothetical protein